MQGFRMIPRRLKAGSIRRVPAASCLYTAAQLREMAQFAVNLVDAMDTDNIVTKFEYDKNLGPDLHGLKKGGWNLDDDPFTMEEAPVSESDPRFAVLSDNGRSREDGLTRGVVYGVESHKCITEVLAVNALPCPDQKDHQLTLHDDSTGRQFLFVELSEGGDYGFENHNAGSVYRLARFDRAHRSHPCGGLGNNGRPFRTLCLDNGRDNAGLLIDVVSFASDISVVNSQLYVDVNDDGQYECIAPWRTDADGPLPTTTTDPQDTEVRSLKCSSSYDVIREWADGRMPLIEDQFGNPMQRPEAFLDDLAPYRGNEPQHKLRGGDYPDTGLTGFDLVLQRRLNPDAINLPHGNVPGEDPNPWVTLDIFRVEFRDLEVHSTDTPLILQSLRLPRITSDERSVSCDASSRAPWTGSAPAESRYNSIGFGDLSTATRGDLGTFLQHFDRPWANFAEIFSVPLCGPENLTTVFQRLNQSPVNQTRAADTNKPWPGFAASAAARFLLPDFPDDPELSLVQNQARDNAWYRLLQFFEVPSRVNQMLGNPVTMQNLPGRLNLNTIRHWEVFAGLVDNPLILDRTLESNPNNEINPQGFVTQDRTLDEHGKIPAVRRDRWLEYLIERDGGFIPGYDPRDTVNAHCKLLIPGSPTAVPFRSLAHRSTARFEQPANHGIDQTLLRTLTADRVDHDPLTNRHWLELGNAEQHKSNVTSTAMHLHQVLGKMFTNTTTTSNTFIVFATAAYFEAVEHKLPNGEGSGLHRIGARININPAKPRTENENPGWSQRAVFVIDRSEVLQAYDSNLGEFDWRKLVKSRLVLD
jgi:hypothetical protein